MSFYILFPHLTFERLNVISDFICNLQAALRTQIIIFKWDMQKALRSLVRLKNIKISPALRH